MALALIGLLYGCAAPASERPDRPPNAVTTPVALAAAQPSLAAGVGDRAEGDPVELVLVYADRVRGLQAPELAQEIARLGEGGESPARLLQLALALGQTKTAANGLRAQALLQRVLSQNDTEARAVHPLARLISVQLADARRAEEQSERQMQQLRDFQRRIEQLHDRLEALRAIERSLPSRPAAAGASAPAMARP